MFTSVISASQIFQTNLGSQGIQIYYPAFDAIKYNSSFNLFIHTSNISNGWAFNNTQVDCYLDLYNTTGDETLSRTLMEKDSNGWDHVLFVDGGNFSDIGQHAFYIQCNRTVEGLGGQANGVFDVNNSGEILLTSVAIIYIGFLSLMVIVMIFFIFLAFYVIDIKWKVGFASVTYLMALTFITACWMLSYDYLLLNYLTVIFEILFYVAIIGFFPFIIILSLYLITQALFAQSVEEFVNMGYTREEAIKKLKK